jgi:hypothetical protein
MVSRNETGGSFFRQVLVAISRSTPAFGNNQPNGSLCRAPSRATSAFNTQNDHSSYEAAWEAIVASFDGEFRRDLDTPPTDPGKGDANIRPNAYYRSPELEVTSDWVIYSGGRLRVADLDSTSLARTERLTTARLALFIFAATFFSGTGYLAFQLVTSRPIAYRAILICLVTAVVMGLAVARMKRLARVKLLVWRRGLGTPVVVAVPRNLNKARSMLRAIDSAMRLTGDNSLV